MAHPRLLVSISPISVLTFSVYFSYCWGVTGARTVDENAIACAHEYHMKVTQQPLARAVA